MDYTCVSRSALVALLLGIGGSVQAATFYVSPRGSDANSCSAAQSAAAPSSQKFTIAAGVACLAAGDTLLIHGGTYSGRDNTIDSQSHPVASGASWSAPVSIAGVPGELVILQPPDNVSAIRLTTGAPHFLIFKDLTIDMVNSTTAGGATASGIYVGNGSHHNRFQRLEVKNNSGNGIHFSDTNGNSPFNEVLNCAVHHNGGPGINTGYGFYITTSDNLLDGNAVYSNSGYGFHLYDNAGEKNVNRNIIRNNAVHGNGTHGGSNYGIVVAWGVDNQVYNNVVDRNRGGILVYTESGRAGIYNNTVYDNQPLEGIALQYYASAPTVENNIAYSNGADIRDYGGSGLAVINHNVTTNPLFVNPQARDFSLASGSPAEDAGTAVASITSDYRGVVRPQGNGYDVGAFEATLNIQPPLPPRNLRLPAAN